MAAPWEEDEIINLGAPPAPAAAPAPARGGSGAIGLKPTAPKIPEHVMSREEKIAAQIPADKLDLPYRMDENGNVSLPPGTLPEKEGKEGKEGEYSLAALDSFNRAIESGQRLLQHPGLGAAVGSRVDPASWGSWNPLEKQGSPQEFFGGTDARGFVAQLGSMKSQIFLPMVQGLKGMGALSDAEGKKLEASIGALDIGMPEDEFRASVNRIIRDLTFYRERSAKGGGAGGEQPPTDEEAAAGEQTTTTPDGRTVRITDPDAEARAETAPGIGRATTPDGRVVLQDTSGQAIVGQDTGIVGEEGGEHAENDPLLAGVNGTVNQMLKDGVPKADILAYLKNKTGGDPLYNRWMMGVAADIDTIENWKKGEGKGYRGNFRVDIEKRKMPNTAMQNFMGSDVGTAGAASVDALTGFNMDTIAGMLGKDPEEVRAAMQAGQAAHPTSALVGTIAGGTTAALGGEAALARAGVPGAIAAPAADVGYGAVAGAGATDVNPETGEAATLGERALGAVEGAVGGAVGNVAGRAVSATGRPAGAAYTRAVNEANIPTTVGQQYAHVPVIGGIIKRTEDRIAGLPLAGDTIKARQLEGIEKFNEAAFNRTLEPIGVKLPPGRVGEAGIDFAQQEVSNAFQKVLNGKSVMPDATFKGKMTTAWNKLAGLKRVGDEVSERVKDILEPRFTGGALSGEDMQLISRELRDLASDYRTDAMHRPIRQALEDVEEAIFDPFRRKHPDMIPDYNKAKLAQKRLYTLADAVNTSVNREGVFMPSALGRADRANTVRTGGKMAAARGNREFKDLQRAAQETLPSKVADSGTVGRLAIPAAALGVGGTVDATTGEETSHKGLTYAAILAGLYTKQGQRLLTKPGRGARSRVGKAVLGSKAVQTLAPKVGTAEGTRRATREEREARAKKKKKAAK